MRLLSALLFFAIPCYGEDPEKPDGTEEAIKAISTFRVPEGLQVELFAAEPHLGSPVAICLDERGRIFVAEQYRFNRGTEENRTRPFLLEDDLQIGSVDERLNMYRKWESEFEGGMSWFTRVSDQVRMLEDLNGDGRGDHFTIFAGSFDGPLDGLAAGVIARDGKVYLTCIPSLWLLEDKDDDGHAEHRSVLHRGFGVNAAFLGHDLHGLVWGPDGKLYFSVGDRGFHVTTKEGKTLHGPRTGGVFRCDPDGANLELIYRGLRNPQELAFDQYGRLFAADNNCDKGDHSRLVYIIEGGTSGWNMAYQTLEAPYLTGPWHAERLWHLPHADQPAYLCPPVGKLGAGPSGFCFYPGVGLPDRYRDHFFLCNYTGNGGIESFALTPKGAGFVTHDEHDFLKPIMATDVDFGYDGKMYLSDYVKLEWHGPGGYGRIYTVSSPELVGSRAIQEVRELFQNGIHRLDTVSLCEYLEHPDLRVRQRAQFALADRGASDELVKIARGDGSELSRLHALWGVGQCARQNPDLLKRVLKQSEDASEHIRAWVVRLCGELRYTPATEVVIRMLRDDAPSVRLQAAIALGKLQARTGSDDLVDLIIRENDQDPWLRHACVMALDGIADDELLTYYSEHHHRAVRLTALLVCRRRESAEIARFLNDPDPQLVVEAARAIHDVPMDAASQELARVIDQIGQSPAEDPALVRRVIAANLRSGRPKDAERLISLAKQSALSSPMRLEIVESLGNWEHPAPRDRVTGFWRPLGTRSVAEVRELVRTNIEELLQVDDPVAMAGWVKACQKLGVPVARETLLVWLLDPNRTTPIRISSLDWLDREGHEFTEEQQAALINSDQPELRIAIRRSITRRSPEQGIPLNLQALRGNQSSLLERQQSLLGLGAIELPVARQLMIEMVNSKTVPEELELELEEVSNSSKDAAFQEQVQKYLKEKDEKSSFGRNRLALWGGDAERGRMLFRSHVQAQCIRCHKHAEFGGTAGPDLTHVAKNLLLVPSDGNKSEDQPAAREYMLRAMLAPNQDIAVGYENVTLELESGLSVSGLVKSEDQAEVVLEKPDGEVARIPKTEITERTRGASLMPEMERVLSIRELRDLVEFLVNSR